MRLSILKNGIPGMRPDPGCCGFAGVKAIAAGARGILDFIAFLV